MNIQRKLARTPVAIIGLSAIFPEAKNVQEYWHNIITAKDCIRDVPENRWNIEDYYHPDPNTPDRTYCKRGGFIPEIEFNPLEFGLPPNTLEVTDSSQLLALLAARDVFEDAGYGKKSEKFTDALKKKTGVIFGVGGGQKLIVSLTARLQHPIWEKALKSSGIREEDIPPIIEKIQSAYVGWNENSFPGFLGNVIAGRIANKFNLGGINTVVDAACAGSLSALKMSLSELVEGRCDMMLTGGVDMDNSPFMFMAFSKTPAFSTTNQIRPFCEKADGILIGEGIGMLLLKRLDDAERDGDKIYAVIKGIGASSDGKYTSIYAPKSEGQILAIERAYDDAEVPPNTIGLIEAHGTGTSAGDKAEFNAIKAIFGENNCQKQHIAIGSVKSQIGHTKGTAGAAGMIKTALALYHQILPPTIHVKNPNPEFKIENSPFYLNTQTRPWFKGMHPRRAGVSAFGFGGINLHVVMEEYAHSKEMSHLSHCYYPVFIHAYSPQAIKAICKKYIQLLSSDKASEVFYQLINKSREIVVAEQNARIGFLAKNMEDCLKALRIALEQISPHRSIWKHPLGIYYRRNGLNLEQNKLVVLFPDKESQYLNMGKELLFAFPSIREEFERADKVYRQKGQRLLSATTYPIPTFNSVAYQKQQKDLAAEAYASTAVQTLNNGLFKIMYKTGLRPEFYAGAKVEVVQVLNNLSASTKPDFEDQIHDIYNLGGSVFIEIGPGNKLSEKVRDTLKTKAFTLFTLNASKDEDSVLQFMKTFVELKIAGIPLNDINLYSTPPSGKPDTSSKLIVSLSGHNYVSPCTKKQYQKTLNNGFKVSFEPESVKEPKIIHE